MGRRDDMFRNCCWCENFWKLGDETSSKMKIGDVGWWMIVSNSLSLKKCLACHFPTLARTIWSRSPRWCRSVGGGIQIHYRSDSKLAWYVVSSLFNHHANVTSRHDGGAPTPANRTLLARLEAAKKKTLNLSPKEWESAHISPAKAEITRMCLACHMCYNLRFAIQDSMCINCWTEPEMNVILSMYTCEVEMRTDSKKKCERTNGRFPKFLKMTWHDSDNGACVCQYL